MTKWILLAAFGFVFMAAAPQVVTGTQSRVIPCDDPVECPADEE